LDGIFGKSKLGNNNGGRGLIYARRRAAAVYMMLYSLGVPNEVSEFRSLSVQHETVVAAEIAESGCRVCVVRAIYGAVPTVLSISEDAQK
jgi:hypothetical protein